MNKLTERFIELMMGMIMVLVVIVPGTALVGFINVFWGSELTDNLLRVGVLGMVISLALFFIAVLGACLTVEVPVE